VELIKRQTNELNTDTSKIVSVRAQEGLRAARRGKDMFPAAMETDPKKPGFSPQRFFADLKRDSDYGNTAAGRLASLTSS
jgi:hypothetical protein